MTLTHDPDCARARKSLQALAGGPGPVLGTKHPPPSPPAARPLSDLLGGGCGISLSVAISYASMLSLLHTWSFFVVANVVSFENQRRLHGRLWRSGAQRQRIRVQAHTTSSSEIQPAEQNSWNI